MDDASLRNQALQCVRENKNRLFEELVSESNYQSDTDASPPAASFMAGTPGAGKTEVSKRFLEKFTAVPIRIDADDLYRKSENPASEVPPFQVEVACGAA